MESRNDMNPDHDDRRSRFPCAGVRAADTVFSILPGGRIFPAGLCDYSGETVLCIK